MEAQTAVSTIRLTAPLTGVMVPIELVPDPVFAKKMVGEGFSIDPLNNELVAPIAGEVADLQPSGHAITIRSAGTPASAAMASERRKNASCRSMTSPGSAANLKS